MDGRAREHCISFMFPFFLFGLEMFAIHSKDIVSGLKKGRTEQVTDQYSVA